MVKRTASATEEPEQSDFPKPSEGEHLFQVSNIYDQQDHPEKFDIDDPDTAIAQVEVVGGDEEGRTMLIQCTLDDSLKKFYYTRMFLKAIGCEYKGSNFPIDSDEWQGKQFYATVIHVLNKDKTKTFANIKEYNFEKMVEQKPAGVSGGEDKDTKPENQPLVKPEDIAWDE